MSRRPSLRIISALLAMFGVLTSVSLAAQQPKVPVQTLGKADAAFDDPFTQIVGVRELRNGQLIVADMRDRTLQKIDLTTGVATALSREGSGPTEYLFPTGAYAFPGDSTAIYDMGNQRYLLLDPAGKPVTTFRMDEGNSGGGMMILRAASAWRASSPMKSSGGCRTGSG